MYTIQANPSGSRSIEVSDEHLQTIDHYQLLRNLTDSNGIIDEAVLDKLKFTVRSLLESADNSEPAAWNDPFIGKFYANFFGFLIALLYQDSVFV